MSTFTNAVAAPATIFLTHIEIKVITCSAQEMPGAQLGSDFTRPQIPAAHETFLSHIFWIWERFYMRKTMHPK